MQSPNKEIRPPSRFLLRWTDRLALPLAGLVSIVTVSLTLWFSPSRSFALWWSGISFIFLVFALLHRSNLDIFPKFLQKHVYRGIVGIYVWLWITLLFIFSAFNADDVINIIALYPQYILPFVLLLTRVPREKSITLSVVVLTFLTAFVLSFGPWIVVSRDKPNTILELNSAFSIGSLIIWGVFGPLTMYYSARRTQLTQIRSQAVQDAMLHLLEIDDPLVSGDEVSRILNERVGVGDRVLLLNYDQHTDTIKVIASSGKNVEKAAGYELPKRRGISRRAINTMKTQYVPNVAKDPDYISGGLPEKGSEISVPIITSHGGVLRVIGTINIQEDARYAFTEDDINIVETFARIIANFDYGYSEKFERLMDIALEKINRFDDPDKLIYQVINALSSLFDSPLICYYRLAIGTGFPLRPCYLKGEFTNPELFVNPNLLTKNSNLMRWLYGWSPKFIRHMKSDEELLDNSYGFGKEFQKEEGVVSMCFLPIGSRSYRVGALLLFFKGQKMFSKSETINMQGFVREVWPHVARTEFVNSILGGFAQPQLHFHSTLAETGLGRGTWESILGEVESSDRISLDLRDKVERLHSGIKVFLDRLRAWEVTQVFQFSGSEFFSIKNALNKACGDLQQRFGGLVVREIDNGLESETNDVKQVVFILVTEALRNAFIHGKTVTQIHLKMNRSDDFITIMISDNGVGFSPQDLLASHNGDPAFTSRGSIFDLDVLAQKLLGAHPIDWLDTSPGRGTRLMWKIPLLTKNPLEQ